jgi:hypothetical protein
VQFEDQSSLQTYVVPNQQPVLPNFLINIQPSQTTSQPPRESNVTQIEQNKKTKKRGRKPNQCWKQSKQLLFELMYVRFNIVEKKIIRVIILMLIAIHI